MIRDLHNEIPIKYFVSQKNIKFIVKNDYWAELKNMNWCYIDNFYMIRYEKALKDWKND